MFIVRVVGTSTEVLRATRRRATLVGFVANWTVSEKFGGAYKEIRLQWHDKIDYQRGSGLVSSYQPGRQLTMAPGLVAKLCCPIRHARRAIQLKNTVKLAQMRIWDVALWPQPTKVAI